MSEQGVRREAAELQGHIASLKAICGSDEELVVDMVEGETDLAAFVDRLVRMIAEDEADAAGVETYIRNLKARKDRLEGRAERLRVLLGAVVVEMPGSKTKTPIATVSVRKLQPDLIVEEEADIPSRWFKQADPKLDKAALRKHLNARREALDAVAKLPEIERPEGLAIADRDFPAVPGVSLDNGDISVTVRVL